MTQCASGPANPGTGWGGALDAEEPSVLATVLATAVPSPASSPIVCYTMAIVFYTRFFTQAPYCTGHCNQVKRLLLPDAQGADLAPLKLHRHCRQAPPPTTT